MFFPVQPVIRPNSLSVKLKKGVAVVKFKPPHISDFTRMQIIVCDSLETGNDSCFTQDLLPTEIQAGRAQVDLSKTHGSTATHSYYFRVVLKDGHLTVFESTKFQARRAACKLIKSSTITFLITCLLQLLSHIREYIRKHWLEL